MKSRHLVFRHHGPPDTALELQDFTLLPLKKGQVLIEIQASPINPADLNFIEGTYGIKPTLPATAGIECFATVLESLSDDFTPGDPVITVAHIGGWADHAIAESKHLIPMPKGIDPLQAAMLKVNPATALLLLTHFEKLENGDWVVLNAANSGVGQCVVQLARELGIQTICFLRNLDFAPELKDLGATQVFEDSADGYSEAKACLANNSAKLAFNAVGGDSALRIMKLLGTGGTHITYGAMSHKPLTVPNGPLIFRNIRIRGLWVTEWIKNASRSELVETYSKLAKLSLQDKLKQAIDQTFDLADYLNALSRLNAKERHGKVLFLKKEPSTI